MKTESIELQIRNMVNQAEKLGWEIVSITIPESEQLKIIYSMVSNSAKDSMVDLKLHSFLGHPVYQGSSLGMTIRVNQLKGGK